MEIMINIIVEVIAYFILSIILILLFNLIEYIIGINLLELLFNLIEYIIGINLVGYFWREVLSSMILLFISIRINPVFYLK